MLEGVGEKRKEKDLEDEIEVAEKEGARVQREQ